MKLDMICVKFDQKMKKVVSLLRR